MSFSFGFASDDIDITSHEAATPHPPPPPATTTTTATQAGAFPVAGKPQLPATRHELSQMLDALPSKIAYDLLDVTLDHGGGVVRLPRRELWDVRVQLMAEEGEGEGEGGGGDADADAYGLGRHDVKTGVYEGGFKSWESSVDLVKVLAAQGKVSAAEQRPLRIIELGCGTGLPSLSLFQWTVEANMVPHHRPRARTSFLVADYNPAVLQLVTLPNLVLGWALAARAHTPALRHAFSTDGGLELELGPAVRAAFQSHLVAHRISLTFLSGAWSPELVRLIHADNDNNDDNTHEEGAAATLLIGAETIYSPFALQAFTETVFSILREEQVRQRQQRQQRQKEASSAVALVGAKRLYFGVGGSLDDFVEEARRRGADVETLREEADGVRRAVVKCTLQS